MATYVITAPDGQEYEVEAPDDVSEDEVLAYAQQNYQNAEPAEGPWTRYAAAPQYTEDDLAAALYRADAAGNTQDARQLAQEIQRLRGGQSPSGAFDDLVPAQGAGQPRSRFGGVPVQGEPRSSGAFDDLIPQASSTGVLDQYRQQHPEYRDVPDLKLASAIRKKYYAHLPPDEFYRRTGLGHLVGDSPAPDPTHGMSNWDLARAGAGESLATVIPGIKQAATESVNRHLGLLDRTLRMGGADGAADWIGRHAGAPVYGSVMRQRQEEADRREQDAPLNATWSGKAGLFGGSLLQMVGPGAVPKLATRVPQLARAAPALEAVGAAFMPKTVRGNAALGLMSGAVQPATGDGDRALNVALGGGLGAAGAAIPRVVGATSRASQNVFNFLGSNGPQRRAYDIIRSEASNPDALLTPNPSAIPGVTRSLFEESLDPGVARLETHSRGTKGSGWIERDSTNNAARINAVREFAGDEAQLADAITARGAATDPLYAAGRRVTGVDTSRLMKQVERLITTEDGRPAVQHGLTTIRDLLASPTGSNGQTLANIRLTIGDMLSGKFGGKSGAALQGSRALMAVQDQLDRVLAKASPEYSRANATYRAMSQPISQMQTGQLLLKRATGSIEDPLTQLPVFSASKLGQQIKSLDTTARSATGFRKAKAGDILMPEHMATLTAVNDDLARSAQRLKYGSGGGSHTASQNGLLARLASQGLGRVVPGIGPAMEFLRDAGATRVQTALTEVLQNPAQYRAIHARLTRPEQGLLEQAMIRLGGTAGRASAITATH